MVTNPDQIQIAWNAADAVGYFESRLVGAKSVDTSELFDVLAAQCGKLFRLLGSAASTGAVHLKIQDAQEEAKVLRLVDAEAEIDGWYGVADDPAPVVLFHGDVVFYVNQR